MTALGTVCEGWGAQAGSHPQLMSSLSLANSKCPLLIHALQLGALEQVCLVGAKHEWPMLSLPIREPADQQLKQHCRCCPHVVGLIHHGFHPVPQKLEQLGRSIYRRKVAVQEIACTPGMAQQARPVLLQLMMESLVHCLRQPTQYLQDLNLVQADAPEVTLHEVRAL